MATLTSLANNYVSALTVANRAQALTGVQSYRSLSSGDTTEQPSGILQEQGESARVKLSAVGQAAAGVAGVRDAAKSLQDTEKTTNTADGARKSVEDFVKAYNEQQSTAAKLTDYGSSAQDRAGGALAGDTRVQASASELRQSVGSSDALSKLGVTTNSDGSLSFDAAAFDKAYAADAKSTQQALGEVGKATEKVASNQLAATGSIGAAQATAQAELNTVQNRQSVIQSQLGNVYSYQQVQSKLEDIAQQFQDYQKQQQQRVDGVGSTSNTSATTSATSSNVASVGKTSTAASTGSLVGSVSGQNSYAASSSLSSSPVPAVDGMSQGSMMSAMIASQVASYQKVFAL